MTQAQFDLAQDAHHDHAHEVDPAQELDNAKTFTWLYIGSEVMIFAAMLATYLIFRVWNWEAVHLAKEHLSIPLVSANTFLLLASSWMMVMGLRSIQQGNNAALVRWIMGTVIFGAIFVGLQVVEYVELTHNGIVLTPRSEEQITAYAEGEAPHWLEEGVLFFREIAATEGEPDTVAASLDDQPMTIAEIETVSQALTQYGMRFYAPTAFHGAHVIIGCLWGLWIATKGARGGFSRERHASVEVFGLYWHFVDVVWIVLFTFIYLI
jgi:heme/copper-type cytochrome/quinol oxidase subunit 3